MDIFLLNEPKEVIEKPLTTQGWRKSSKWISFFHNNSQSKQMRNVNTNTVANSDDNIGK